MKLKPRTGCAGVNPNTIENKEQIHIRPGRRVLQFLNIVHAIGPARL